MARDVIDDYVAELSGRLPGPRRQRAAILAELEDGLRQAAEQYARLGPERAQWAAIAEFGGPDLVAAGFAPEISARRIHRYGLGFALIGPVIGLAWVTAALLGSFAAVPLPLTITGIAVLVGVALVAATCTVIATAATGRAGRWIALSPQRAAKALLGTAVGTVLVDATLLGVLLVLSAQAPHSLVAVPLTLGAVVSSVRIGFATVSVSRLGPDRKLVS